MTLQATAPAPKKSTLGLTITWGLVSIPVKMYTGLDDKAAKVTRSMFTATGNPVGMKPYDKVTGDDVAYDQIVKRTKATDGTLVELTDEEIAAFAGPSSNAAPIETFIPLDSLGTTYTVVGTGFLRPDDLGERAFALLTAVLADEGLAALVTVTARGTTKKLALTPDGRFLEVAYAEQVRQAPPLPEVALDEAELAMAKQLVAAVGVDTPVLTNTAVTAIQEYVDAKAAGEAPEVAVVEDATTVDLLEALTASLAAAA